MTGWCSSELIGYTDLTVFRKIWSEHSLIDIEQKRVGKFLYFNATGYANFSIVELDRSLKKITNRNKRNCWQVLGDWCFVIKTAQLFCMNNCTWYPINSLDRQSVILELTASAAFGKQNPKQNVSSNFAFYNLSFDI